MKTLVVQLMTTIAILRVVEDEGNAQGKGVPDEFRQFGVVCKMHLELVLDTFSSFQRRCEEQKKFKQECVLAGYVTGLASVKQEHHQLPSTLTKFLNLQQQQERLEYIRQCECTRKVNLLSARYPHTKHTHNDKHKAVTNSDTHKHTTLTIHTQHGSE